MKKQILAWIFVIVWMAVIFYLSHQPATESAQLSTGIKDFLLSLLPFAVDEQIVHFLTRKGAHFFAYFILALLLTHALVLQRGQKMSTYLYGLIICVVYAATDEIHQLYIPGRSGEVRDVLLDASGSLTGVIFYQMINYFRRGGKK